MFNPPKLIGHRGVKNLSPENTLDSIILANSLGLKWIEVDVKISKDLKPILLHDDTLDRTTNGKGFPIDYDYDELRKLDAGSFFYDYTTNIYIPTLKDILLFCVKKNMGINIELKPNIGFESANVEAISKVLKNFDLKDKYYFSSFDLKSLILMKQLMPESNYGFLIHEFDKDFSLNKILSICKKYNFVCCGFNKNIIDYNILSSMKSNNLITTVYSEKNLNLKEVEHLWSMGVNSIFTDDPSDVNYF